MPRLCLGGEYVKQGDLYIGRCNGLVTPRFPFPRGDHNRVLVFIRRPRRRIRIHRGDDPLWTCDAHHPPDRTGIEYPGCDHRVVAVLASRSFLLEFVLAVRPALGPRCVLWRLSPITGSNSENHYRTRAAFFRSPIVLATGRSDGNCSPTLIRIACRRNRDWLPLWSHWHRRRNFSDATFAFCSLGENETSGGGFCRLHPGKFNCGPRRFRQRKTNCSTPGLHPLGRRHRRGCHRVLFRQPQVPRSGDFNFARNCSRNRRLQTDLHHLTGLERTPRPGTFGVNVFELSRQPRPAIPVTAMPTAAQCQVTMDCARNQRLRFRRDIASTIHEMRQRSGREIHSAGLPSSAKPIPTSAPLGGDGGYASDAMDAGNSFADAQTPLLPGLSPDRSAPSQRLVRRARVVPARRALRNIFAHSTIGNTRCNNCPTIVLSALVQSHAQNRKSARVYSSEA